jgi:hypothetical protein
MHQLLLAGLVSFGLSGTTSALAAAGSARAGSIAAGAKPVQADTLAETNTYNPTLTARRQPQPMIAAPDLPEEVAPLGPSSGLRSNSSDSGSLLDELEPPKPIVPSRIIENPVVDEGATAEMPAYPWSSGSWFFSGHRYVELEFVVFERNRPRRARPILAFDAATGGIALRSYSQTFGVEPGMRATIGQNLFRDHLNRDHSVEFTFFGLSDFEINDQANGVVDNSLFIVNIAGFNASDTVTTDYSSSFQSYELNYKIRTRLERDRMIMGPDGSWVRQYTHGHTFSFLAGLRHAAFYEDLLISSRQTGVAVDVYSGDGRFNTENDLFGFQIGGELRSQYETWSWGVLGKAGAYVNFSERLNQISSSNTIISDAAAALQDAAFLGELNIYAAYNLSPNWTLRASLDMIVLGGVAQAPYNINYSIVPISEVRNSGTVELMGMSFGMEAVW